LRYTYKAATGRTADLRRASARKEEAQSKSKACENSVEEYGMTFRDKIMVATLEIKKQEMLGSQYDTALISLHLQANLLHKQIERAEHHGDYDKVEILEEKGEAILLEMELIQTKMNEAHTSVDLANTTLYQKCTAGIFSVPPLR
jgi:hypothetical protein